MASHLGWDAAKRKARRIRKQALRVGRLMRERGARPS